MLGRMLALLSHINSNEIGWATSAGVSNDDDTLTSEIGERRCVHWSRQCSMNMSMRIASNAPGSETPPGAIDEDDVLENGERMCVHWWRQGASQLLDSSALSSEARCAHIMSHSALRSELSAVGSHVGTRQQECVDIMSQMRRTFIVLN